MILWQINMLQQCMTVTGLYKKVLDIDRDDGDVNISFMERLKTKGEQSELKYK